MISVANPAQADDYISQYGLDIAATNDPEDFWGPFGGGYVPNSFLFNLQTMELVWMEVGGLYPSEIRSLLDTYL